MKQTKKDIQIELRRTFTIIFSALINKDIDTLIPYLIQLGKYVNNTFGHNHIENHLKQLKKIKHDVAKIELPNMNLLLAIFNAKGLLDINDFHKANPFMPEYYILTMITHGLIVADTLWNKASKRLDEITDEFITNTKKAKEIIKAIACPSERKDYLDSINLLKESSLKLKPYTDKRVILELAEKLTEEGDLFYIRMLNEPENKRLLANEFHGRTKFYVNSAKTSLSKEANDYLMPIFKNVGLCIAGLITFGLAFAIRATYVKYKTGKTFLFFGQTNAYKRLSNVSDRIEQVAIAAVNNC